MKNSSVSYLVILFITLTFIFGCKKDNSNKDYYSGNYSFTTTFSYYPDSVNHYDGSISYDKTTKVLTVNYMIEVYNPHFDFTIHPIVDDNGILSCPGFSSIQGPNSLFFNGNIDFDGNINFKVGQTVTKWNETHETSRIVTGYKK